MSDLTTFLFARLDEDEADANDAAQAIHFPVDRLRAEVQAKRNLIAGHPCEDAEFGPCDDLRYMGEVYADHPDYREEWRP